LICFGNREIFQQWVVDGRFPLGGGPSIRRKVKRKASDIAKCEPNNVRFVDVRRKEENVKARKKPKIEGTEPIPLNPTQSNTRAYFNWLRL
jgi:hypothetical protein